MVKSPLANAGDIRDRSSIPGSGRFPRGGHGNQLQYSRLENPMDRGAWWATVHGVAKSQTQLSNFHFHFQRASLIAQLVKNPSAMQETLIRFLGWEDPLEKE